MCFSTNFTSKYSMYLFMYQKYEETARIITVTVS